MGISFKDLAAKDVGKVNFFIIGGSGYLGQYVIRELLKKREDLKIYCLIHHTQLPVEDERIIKVYGSIERLNTVRIRDKIDACVILSGVMDGMEAGAEKIMEINYKGTAAAAAFCRKKHISRICLVSSMNVKMERQGIYARSKCMAEKAVRDSGLTYLIFRPSLIYGAGCGRGLKVIEDSIMKYGFVPVFGDGEKKEQPILVDECAALIAYYLLGDSWNRTIELLGKNAVTYNQMCRLTAEVLGKKVRLFHIPAWPCISALRILEFLHIKFPVSSEQIYHIDTDLSGDMEEIYRETRICAGTFERNMRKIR